MTATGQTLEFRDPFLCVGSRPPLRSPEQSIDHLDEGDGLLADVRNNTEDGHGDLHRLIIRELE